MGLHIYVKILVLAKNSTELLKLGSGCDRHQSLPIIKSKKIQMETRFKNSMAEQLLIVPVPQLRS
jgi:hypothetical protein